jgi:hypothetical protein
LVEEKLKLLITHQTKETQIVMTTLVTSKTIRTRTLLIRKAMRTLSTNSRGEYVIRIWSGFLIIKVAALGESRMESPMRSFQDVVIEVLIYACTP